MTKLAVPLVVTLIQVGYLLGAARLLAALARRRPRPAGAEPVSAHSPPALRYLLRRRFGQLATRAPLSAKGLALDLGLFGWREDDAVALGAAVLDLAALGFLTIEGTPTAAF